MRFLYKPFEAKKKQIIEVEIDVPTKVKFLTGKEMKAYKQGRTHTYIGGLYEESPIRFVVPYDSVWNVVVEKGTHREPLEVNAKCHLTPPNNSVRTSIPVDASQDVLAAMNAEENADAIAAEMNIAGQSEG
jgi:hypothetical protein